MVVVREYKEKRMGLKEWIPKMDNTVNKGTDDKDVIADFQAASTILMSSFELIRSNSEFMESNKTFQEMNGPERRMAIELDSFIARFNIECVNSDTITWIIRGVKFSIKDGRMCEEFRRHVSRLKFIGIKR
jgi:hypothetical protein